MPASLNTSKHKQKGHGPMCTHVVELEIKRFYRVYVEDEDNAKTNEEVVKEAVKMALESEDNIQIDEELEIEEQDILDAHYEYDF